MRVVELGDGHLVAAGPAFPSLERNVELAELVEVVVGMGLAGPTVEDLDKRPVGVEVVQLSVEVGEALTDGLGGRLDALQVGLGGVESFLVGVDEVTRRASMAEAGTLQVLVGGFEP